MCARNLLIRLAFSICLSFMFFGISHDSDDSSPMSGYFFVSLSGRITGWWPLRCFVFYCLSTCIPDNLGSVTWDLACLELMALCLASPPAPSMMLCTIRITEMVERVLWRSLSPIPAKAGFLQQVVEVGIQASLEYLMRRRLHHLCRQSVPVPHHPHSKGVLSHVQMKLPVFQFMASALSSCLAP